MLIQSLKVSGLLSFGPNGIDLPMHNLNVLIGPNGSGKSNLLAVLELLRGAAIHLEVPIQLSGGIDHWLWKKRSNEHAPGSPLPGRIEVLVHVPAADGKGGLRHTMELSSYDHRLDVTREVIANVHPTFAWPDQEPFWFYRYENGRALLQEHTGPGGSFEREQLEKGASILSQVKNPGLPENSPFAYLPSRYSKIRVYRDWAFGPSGICRGMRPTDERADSLTFDGSNLAVLLDTFPTPRRRELVKHLSALYEDITGFRIEHRGQLARLLLEEQDSREIPSERISDGTLRYIFLLAVLLDPTPPPLILMEEPELGLHPDVIPRIAELLKNASKRTQLVVTTHSRMLIDALSDQPDSVIVCGKENGETTMERLSSDDLAEWLERYSLGDLWSRGEIGGNRW